MECIVCMENINTLKCTRCVCRICRLCYTKLKKKDCPICRLESKDFIPIFFNTLSTKDFDKLNFKIGKGICDETLGVSLSDLKWRSMEYIYNKIKEKDMMNIHYKTYEEILNLLVKKD